MVAEAVFTTGKTGSYCSVADVVRLVAGHELGTAEEMAERAAGALAASRGLVESYTGRDFFRHEEIEATLDGMGTDRLHLTTTGVCPPVAVHSVRVAGRTLAASEWRAYMNVGIVRLTGEGALGRFPVGVGNVTVEVTWGPPSPPEAVMLAQAKFAAAELLGQMGGEAGAVRSTRIGEYAVTYGEAGRYAAVAERLVREAQEILTPYRRLRMATV